MAFSNTDNTLNTSTSLNITSGSSTISGGGIGSSDTEDFFRFSLSARSSLNISLNGLTTNADLQLIRDGNNNGLVDSGETLASSILQGTSAELIGTTLDGGTYFVRVFSNSTENTNYNLNFWTTPDFAGNSIKAARDIGLRSTVTTFSDWVGKADGDDFYNFGLSTRSNFNLTLNNLISNADVQIIRDANNNKIVDSGEIISSSTLTGTTAESISVALDAGAYSIGVFSNNGSDTTYNLNVSATAVVEPDYAGNTIGTAREIVVGSSVTNFNDWVGSTDTNDFYRFNLSDRSTFNLSLGGLSANADVQLIRDANSNGIIDSGETIASSAATGTTAESISTALDAGTYLLRVFPNGTANTSYNLGVSATPIIPDNAGNAIATARNITLSSSTTTFSDWVGTTDTDDFYRFSLSARSTFNLNLGGLSANADVQLIRDANSNGVVDSGEVINSSTATSTTAGSISTALDAGTYLLRVFPNGTANTSYDLGVSATPIIPDNAGNAIATARNITLSSSATTFSDWVGTTDTDDFYRFSLSARSNFNLNFGGLSANADVQLIRDANSNGVVDSGEVINSSAATSTTAGSISTALDTGTYLLRVFPNSSANTNYNLSLSATAVTTTTTITDSAGNTIRTARDIGISSRTTTLSDWVGATDTDDFYAFGLSVRSDFNLSLTGLVGNADVQLIRDANANKIIDSGEVISFSAAAGTTSESILATLDAGAYLIRVFPTGGASTNYNLNLSATTAIVDNAGNSMGTARQVSVGTTAVNFSDWVGSTDTNDFYRFNLSDRSSLSLNLNNLSANADVQLIRDANNNGVVDSGEVINSSANIGTTAEAISTILDAGSYFVRVYPTGGANTNYSLSLSAATVPTITSNVTDWYSQNLRDSGLVSLTRSLMSDGSLSRNDVIAIFKDASDGGIVDATEFTDLATIVTNASTLKMQDHVRVLANKVVNGDPANTKSGIGNLSGGSTSAVMDRLIGKWLLGNERPKTMETAHIYQYAQGSLFQNGISVSDIKQGRVGDCYFLVGLASLANEAPDQIRNMFIDNGDGTFTVRFFNNGKADYVTVDRMLPTDSSGKLVYAGMGSLVSDINNELWVALAEKAYAQLNESGWIKQDGTNSYLGIESGIPNNAIEQLTGRLSYWDHISWMTEPQLVSLSNSNKMLTVAFNNTASGLDVILEHVYAVTSYNSTTQKFFAYNPWGTRHLELTWQNLKDLNSVFTWEL